jgi:hypothetical protein
MTIGCHGYSIAKALELPWPLGTVLKTKYGVKYF